ncbi:hypothetical protein KO481_06650 [Nocardia sp. NEAU-G5]|uniref:ESX-1 secretion-associated protein n=1 Tax=Nocardia albiluteola TaxID=2842303 RepID=A0ABS6AUJ0_9NOCA|nr:type VII secretion target [Nocardia albiluteola]MBU3061201.1 hypothetical protein [Nocardia albiluteola]
MSGNIDAEPDKIRAHAKNVLTVGDSLTQALNAAKSTTAPSNAFGKICAFLPPLFVDTVEEDGINAIKSAQDSLDNDVTTLNKAADGLETQDTSNAARLNAVSVSKAIS